MVTPIKNLLTSFIQEGQKELDRQKTIETIIKTTIKKNFAIT